jgi:quercetin dioxygenase-like cupin family protein
MNKLERLLWVCIACFTGLIGYGSAQTNPARPDPTHVEFILAKDMNWEGTGGQRHVNLVGDPAKPGLYIRLAKWLAGNYSRPHFHDIERYFYVVSGAWWVSSSTKYDPATTYPMTTGTFVTHHANTVHFDGANPKEDGVILEIGVGPMKSASCSDTPTPAPCK